jgi:hypothetical protein
VNLVFGPPTLDRAERIALKRSLLVAGGGALGGDWDLPAPRTFTELEVFEALKARLVSHRPWSETVFYERVLRDFERGRTKWGCTTEADLLARLQAIEDLHGRIASEGYKTQEELGSRDLSDEVRVAVTRDGRLLFVDGRHRLAIARLLGLERIPARIVARHEDWQAFRVAVEQYAAEHRGRVYQRIDHPDLADVPAGHGDDRSAMLVEALSGHQPGGKRLLDIGTHWGHMCQQMERLGFVCTGVERNKASVAFAERLRVATESSFEVWQGDVFDYPAPGDFDVVLALNIFHHFLKTQATHDRLLEFLGRLDADVIVFEPHRHDPPAQMRDAYLNPAPDEFVALVMRHARMTSSECLGAASDGRLLYKLTR